MIENPSEGARVEIIGHTELEPHERVGRITALSDDPTIPDACVVLFDDGTEDVLSFSELNYEEQKTRSKE
jgi:hypothetical protein